MTELEIVYVLQPTANRRRSKNLPQKLDWVVLTLLRRFKNNNDLTFKVGTDESQVVHQKRIRAISLRKYTPDVKTTLRYRNPHHEVSIKHDIKHVSLRLSMSV